MAKPLTNNPKSTQNLKVLICNNCKQFWVAPTAKCDCGCSTLTQTHDSNLVFSKNYKSVK